MPPGPMPERSLSVQEPGVPVSIADAAKAAEVQRAHEEVTEARAAPFLRQTQALCPCQPARRLCGLPLVVLSYE